jgi:serine/threonine protein kinase
MSTGSFGKVYYGLWSGAQVAVKVIETLDKDGSGQSKFEGALAVSISHPNLVQTYMWNTRQKIETSLGKDIEVPPGPMTTETWIVLEWCELGTLQQRLKKEANELGITAQEAEKPVRKDILLQALENALEIVFAGHYLHGRGIIHGDLTPNNVLLKNHNSRKGFICKVCDFGLARIIDDADTEIMTKSLGTVTHVPPELLAFGTQKARLSQKADVYAFGIMFWQMITKRIPFQGLAAPQIVLKVVKNQRPELPSDLPQTLRVMYELCTDHEPGNRPSFETCINRLSSISQHLQ